MHLKELVHVTLHLAQGLAEQRQLPDSSLPAPNLKTERLCPLHVTITLMSLTNIKLSKASLFPFNNRLLLLLLSRFSRVRLCATP